MDVPTPVWVISAAALGAAFLKLGFDFVVKVLAMRRAETPPAVLAAASDSLAIADLARDLKSAIAKLDQLHIDLQVLVTEGRSRAAKLAELEVEIDKLESRVRALERTVAQLEARR